MSFTLEIELEGMMAFFPRTNQSVTDLVLLRSDGNHTHSHTAQLLLGPSSKKIKGDLPLLLDQFDLEIWAKGSPLTTTGTVSHSFLGSPPLFEMFSPKDMKDGVIFDPKVRIPSVCSARMQLVGGEVYSESETQREWQLVRKAGSPISNSNRLLTKRYLFRRQIDDASVEFRVFRWKNGKREKQSSIVIAPLNGTSAGMRLSNLYDDVSSDVPVDPHKAENAPHFDLVFGLVKAGHAYSDCYLQQIPGAKAHTDMQEIRRLQMPCVGGCGC